MMKPLQFKDRWERLNDLYQQASKLPAEEVDAFCREKCADDDELSTYLISLLNAPVVDEENLKNAISSLANEVSTPKSLIGQRAGAYRIDEILGYGGMGEVYLASRVDGEFAKKVAVKVVHHRPNRNDFLSHFKSERQIMANLDHPFIPKLIDSGQLKDGRPYFICEYIDGLQIDHYCEENNLSVLERIRLVIKVCDAMQVAHSSLVLHLDIKPENILVRDHGEPSLLDFGIARIMTDANEGASAFSPGYASPEQLTGGLLSTSSDVYSLGLLLFVLLIGESPIDDNKNATVTNILDMQNNFSQQDSESDIWKGIDHDLRLIIKKATMLEPADRYSSASDMMQDLQRYTEQVPIQARSKSFGYIIQRFLQRHSSVAGLGALALLLISALALHGLDLRRQAEFSTLSASLTPLTEDTDTGEIATNIYLLLDSYVFFSGDHNAPQSTYDQRITSGTKHLMRAVSNSSLSKIEAAKFLRLVGDVLGSRGLHTQQLLLLQSALSGIDQSEPQRNTLSAELNTELAKVHYATGQYALAEHWLDQSNQLLDTLISASAKSTIEVPAYDHVLQMKDENIVLTAEILHQQGKFSQAATLLESVISRDKEKLGSYHPRYAFHLAILADVHKAQGLVDLAETKYVEALNVLMKASLDQYGNTDQYDHGNIKFNRLISSYSELLRDSGREVEIEKLNRLIK